MKYLADILRAMSPLNVCPRIVEQARQLAIASVLAACAAGVEPQKSPTAPRPPSTRPAEPGAQGSEPTTPRVGPETATRSTSAPRAPGCVDTPFTWHEVEPGLETLDELLDLDGDQRPDRLVGSASWGSGEAMRVVTVELTRDHSTIEVSTSSSFDTMISREAVPARLVGLADVRRAVELALFDRVCDVPDPSLALVLAGTPAWSAGQPTLVSSYAVLVGNEWIVYAALNHRRTAKLDLTGGFRNAARQGSLVLLTTAHGAVVVDERNDRHSWVFVIESAKRKLRFPSVTKAELRGDRALITVDGVVTEARLPAP